MPELPEVQTMIDALIEDGICNKALLNVNIYIPKILKNRKVNEFKKEIINSKITKLSRVGKYIVLHLNTKKIILIHLRMEGKLFLERKNSYPLDKKHLAIEIEMKNNSLLYYDTRRFGTFHIYNESDYLNSKELSKIGLDPLSDLFDWKYLKNNISKSKKYIKTSLLDQKNVSGIGNIYADEILFASKISPLRISTSISDNEFKLIAKHSKLILEKSIENKGTTIHSYLFKKEMSGGFQKFLKIHLKKNLPCLICKTKIDKIKVNGRGTYYCPKCQK